ncbi:carbohydrate sulfotransferase 5-like [Glandiceps talaboti]
MKTRRYGVLLTLVIISAIFIALGSKFIPTIRFKGRGSDFKPSQNDVDENVHLTADTIGRKGTNIMIFARKRTGSTMTGELFSIHPDCFYVYEPGRIVAQHVSRISFENWESLEDFRPQVMNFLDGIYSCNFTNHEYMMSDLNDTNLYRNRGRYPSPNNLTIRSITNYCKSKKNVVTKVLRLYNIFLAAPLLIKHDIKVIHLIRDPRGMIKSRELFRKRSKALSTPGEFHINEHMEEEIADYCRWLDTNYLVSRHAPDWFRNNYMLVRYEDIAEDPGTMVPKLYEFVGMPTDDVMDRISKDIIGEKPGNAQAWRNGVTFDNVKEIQKLCPTRIWNMFGYKLVDNSDMLTDNSINLVTKMDLDSYFNYNDVTVNSTREIIKDKEYVANKSIGI